jgi:hypothetical protein
MIDNPNFRNKVLEDAMLFLPGEAKCGLKKFVATNSGFPLTIASGCTGSGTIVHAFDALMVTISKWASRQRDVHTPSDIKENVMVPTTILWMCESDELKRQYLRQVFGNPKIVHDAKDMGEVVLEDKDNDYTFMPAEADFGECGWPCQDVSSMNTHARDNKTCIVAGSGKTGQGFACFIGLLKSHHAPMFALGENVFASIR